MDWTAAVVWVKIVEVEVLEFRTLGSGSVGSSCQTRRVGSEVVDENGSMLW